VTLTLHDERVQGWLTSGIIHILLLLLCLQVAVNITTLPEPLAEILFLEAPMAPSRGAVEPDQGTPVATAPRPQPASDRVQLPEHRPIPVPPERAVTTPLRQQPPITPERPASLAEQLIRPGLERPPTALGNPEGAKRTAPTGTVGVSGPPGENPTMGPTGPWQIEWVGAGREVVRSVLPQVPAGVEREIVLRFGFEVTPAGEVSGIRPLQKGEPALEEASLNALRQWQFQPLPAAAPQVAQQAVISFRFRIR
jgi:outer membrane biosynthesis protein TonB